MKVYVVNAGQYSEQHIVKVCATKPLADQVIEDLIKEDWNAYGLKYQEQYRAELEKYKQLNMNYDESYWGSWNKSFHTYRERALDNFEVEEYEVLE
jgi:hypothetical protein